MLLQRGNGRGTRGQSSDRSRGRGGRGRGASTSSGEFLHSVSPVTSRASRAWQGSSTGRGNNSRGRSSYPNNQNPFLKPARSRGSLRSYIAERAIDAFEQERLANAAKREQQRSNPAIGRGRGGAFSSNAQNGEHIKSSSTRGGKSSRDSSPSNPFAPSRSASPSVPTPPAQPSNPFNSKPNTNAASNPFATKPKNPFATSSQPIASSPFGASSQPNASSVFGAPSQPAVSSVFGASSQPAVSSVFGAPSQPAASSIFGAPSQPASKNPFEQRSSSGSERSSSPFGVVTTLPTSKNSVTSNAFTSISSIQPTGIGIFGAKSTVSDGTTSSTSFGNSTSNSQTSSAIFGTSSSNRPPKFPNSSASTAPTPFRSPFSTVSSPSFGTPAANKAAEKSPNWPGLQPKAHISSNAFSNQTTGTFPPAAASPFFSSKSSSNSGSKNALNSGFKSQQFNAPSRKPSPSIPSQMAGTSNHNSWGTKLEAHLSKEKIFRPKAPVADPGDPRHKAEIEKFFQGPLKTYRSKARKSLMQAGLIDDPDKPKKLSEAIAFKGTCETMCPYKEMFERIIEGPTAVANLEKRRAGDGSMWPSLDAMVKKHSRSAAGDEAPLPEDVRSPRALRMTLDYLFYNLLDEADELRKVHGFLWDRTRAIRRDFIFQSSFTPTEHADYVYCLELIARFHVLALHQMSRADLAASDFSEQQEREQLAKTLLSLMHEYDDCRAQGVNCENEPEFRAYYALFHAETPNVMESVQDWEARFWENSEEVPIAVGLVEALQNVWDIKGPQKPYESTDVALNAFINFFTIVEDHETSYTMACFAELHFNRVRKGALKTILAAYRKQRDQTKEWTLSKLNEWLRFDDEMDIVSFGEAYGLRFDEGDDGELYLSFEGQDSPTDPFPVYKQQHSFQLVERKRGSLRLVQLIAQATYENKDISENPEPRDAFAVSKGANSERSAGTDGVQVEAAENSSEEDGLFVKNTDSSKNAGIFSNSSGSTTTPFPSRPEQPANASILSAPTTNKGPSQPVSVFDTIETVKNFGNDFFTRNSSPAPNISTQGDTPSIPKETANSTATIQPVASSSSSVFSFLNPTQPQVSSEKTQSPFSAKDEGPKNNSATQPIGLPASSPQSNPSVLGSIPAISSFQGPASTPPSPFATSNIPPKPAFHFISESSGPASPLARPALPVPTTTPSTVIQSISQPVAQQSKGILPPAPSSAENTRRFTNFLNWYTLGEDGIIDQFQEFMLDGILKSVMDVYVKEESDRLALEEATKARREADEYRLQFLMSKYAGRWKGIVRRIHVRKHRVETQRLRQEMAAAAKAKKEALSASLVDDFRASTQTSRNRQQHRREHSLDSLLDIDLDTRATTIMSSDIDQRRSTKRERRESRKERNSASQNFRRSENGLKHSVDNPLRRSLADHPSYMSGESRIHLLKNYHEDRRQPSGVQTDYFRLKARGIQTMPDGSPLASSVVASQLRTKRSFDKLHRDEPRHNGAAHAKSRSVSANQSWDEPEPSTSGQHFHGTDLEALKVRARNVLALEQNEAEKEKTAKKRRSLDVEEEELFERAKRVKASMDEGAAWYREQIVKDSRERTGSFGSH